MTPTARTLAYLRKAGYTAAVTERWNPFAHIRQDLYGFIDVLACREGEILAVQSTTGANLSSRLAKIKAEPRARVWLAAGGKIVVHGWAKQGARGKRKTWVCRFVHVDNLQEVPA
jgi:carbonic anhydrase